MTERLYTSTPVKLLHNLNRLKEMQLGFFRPISIQFAPTDKCNLNCEFCSVQNRDGDEISFSDAQLALKDFSNLGAKTVEFTGGGEPLMYEDIEQLIEYAHKLDYKIGLITNGIYLSKIINCRQWIDWVRVSLNSLDYVKDIHIPELKFLGFSYVINDKTTAATFERIAEYKRKYDAKYVRIVPNCLSIATIEESRQKAAVLLKEGEGFFFQAKKYEVPKRCWMGYIKPFVAPDGYVYVCSANPLIGRKFDSRFRIGHVSNIREIYKSDMPFDASICEEGKCFFKEHNDLIEDVICRMEHGDFI